MMSRTDAMPLLLRHVATGVNRASTPCSNQFATHRGMDTPGQRLAQAREAKGYRSARQAAMTLGVPVSTYNSHERAGEPGARMFNIERAKFYARAFGVDYIWLLTGEKPGSRRRGLPERVEQAIDVLSELRGSDLEFALRQLALFAEHTQGSPEPADG